MNPPAVLTVTGSTAGAAVFQTLRFGDQVQHVETEPLDAFFLPEADHVFQLFPDFRILPVQIRLRLVEQVQIPLVQRGYILPCGRSETARPIQRRPAVHAVPENIVVHIFRIAFQRLLEPDVIPGSVIENHVEHEAHAERVRFRDHRLAVRHGTEQGIHGAVVRHVIAVVEHGRRIEGRHPDIIHAEAFHIGQFGADAVQVPDSVAVGITERLDVNLVNHTVFEITQGRPLLLAYISHTGKSVPRMHRRLYGYDTDCYSAWAIISCPAVTSFPASKRNFP